MRAFVADGLGAGADGHDRHVNLKAEVLALIVQFAGEAALIADQSRDARSRSAFFNEIGEAETRIGPSGLKALLDIQQQAAHRLIAYFSVPFFQGLNKAAHVGALECGGQIHAKVHAGNGLLRALGSVAYQQGQAEFAHPHAVYVQGHQRGMALHVFHYARSSPVVVPVKVPCLTPRQAMSLSARARMRLGSPLSTRTSRQL